MHKKYYLHNKDVKVVVEMPGIEKRDIKINAHDDTVEVFTTDTAEKIQEDN